MKPKVSVIIPVYNSEKFIRNTLNSVLNQNFSNYEIIVVNDGSTDESLNIVKLFLSQNKRSDVQIKIADLGKNKGVSVARNKGIELAAGEFIVFFDSDDIMLPNYLKDLYYAIIDSKSDLSYGMFDYVDEQLNVLTTFESIYTMTSNFTTDNITLLRNIFNGNTWVGLCTSMFKKEVITKFNLKFKRGVPLAEDIEFTLKYIYYSTEASFVSQKVMLYIQHPFSATKRRNIKKRFHVYSTFRRLNKFFLDHLPQNDPVYLDFKKFMQKFIFDSFLKPIVLSRDLTSKKFLKQLLKNEEFKSLIKLSNNFKDRVTWALAKNPRISHLISPLLLKAINRGMSKGGKIC